MRFVCSLAIAAALAASFSGCTSTGIQSTASYNPGYGPFDRNGNYVEAWADKPARKHWWSRKPAEAPKPTPAPPAVAKKDPPRLASNTTRRPEPNRGVLRTSQPTRPVAVSRPPAPPPVSRPPVLAASTARSPAASPPPRPKPKPKPTPRPKPSIRHTVKKGDTLYSLSRRYGSSVSAIQRANGISGTTIRVGQSLRIPK